MNNLHVKTGDTAVVLSGKEKGKRGKILSVNPKKGMVVIEGVNACLIKFTFSITDSLDLSMPSRSEIS